MFCIEVIDLNLTRNLIKEPTDGGRLKIVEGISSVTCRWLLLKTFTFAKMSGHFESQDAWTIPEFVDAKRVGITSMVSCLELIFCLLTSSTKYFSGISKHPLDEEFCDFSILSAMSLTKVSFWRQSVVFDLTGLFLFRFLLFTWQVLKSSFNLLKGAQSDLSSSTSECLTLTFVISFPCPMLGETQHSIFSS